LLELAVLELPPDDDELVLDDDAVLPVDTV
jgi:hypothetical protein